MFYLLSLRKEERKFVQGSALIPLSQLERMQHKCERGRNGLEEQNGRFSFAQCLFVPKDETRKTREERRRKSGEVPNSQLRARECQKTAFYRGAPHSSKLV